MGERTKKEITASPVSCLAILTQLLCVQKYIDRAQWSLGSRWSVNSLVCLDLLWEHPIEFCNIAVAQFPIRLLSPSKNKEINNVSSVCLLPLGIQSLQILSMRAVTAEGGQTGRKAFLSLGASLCPPYSLWLSTGWFSNTAQWEGCHDGLWHCLPGLKQGPESPWSLIMQERRQTNGSTTWLVCQQIFGSLNLEITILAVMFKCCQVRQTNKPSFFDCCWRVSEPMVIGSIPMNKASLESSVLTKAIIFL
jgi:hypothetical protein